MRYVMRAYGRRAGVSGPRDVTEIRLRAGAADHAVEEARSHWERHGVARRWRGYSVFDAAGGLVEYIPGDGS